MSEVPQRSTAPRLLVGRLLAEFLVIVIGVLVALAVDEWRADRKDRARALQYAARLEANLRADTAALSRYRSILEEKRQVLRQLGGEGPRGKPWTGIAGRSSIPPKRSGADSMYWPATRASPRLRTRNGRTPRESPE